jgi:endonuclease/exonuclease/phosphatase family metal-dependent hydrolase
VVLGAVVFVIPLVLSALVAMLVPVAQSTEKAPTLMGEATIESRFVTYNVRCGVDAAGEVYDLSRTAEVIKRLAASVVFLQELTDMGMSDDGWVGTTKVNSDPNRKKVDQLAELKRMTGFKEGRYFGAHDLAENGPERSGTFGVGILSNLSILQTKTRQYKRLPGRQSRGALAVKVRSGEETHVWCVCTHLQNDVTGFEQESQAAELIDFCNELDGPIVVGGDFNSLPQFAAVRMLRQHFGGGCEGVPKRSTFPIFNAGSSLGITLDYMFVRGVHISSGLVVVEEEYASDHFPCVMGLQV